MQATFKRIGTILVAAAAMAHSTSAGAADLAPAGMNILGWPGMTSPAFGCLLEETFGHRDPRFNCGLKSVKAGDPCIDTDTYYAGPKFPPALAARIHPLASTVSLAFEHGKMQAVTITLSGKFSEADVRRAFGLSDDRGPPGNIMSVSVQDCSLVSTCLLLTGFEHMGAGDVDCSKRAPGR